MASLIGILISFIKLAEVFFNLQAKRSQEKQTRHAVLTLQKYKERLEISLIARRRSRSKHVDADNSDNRANSMPDDGYRRD